MAVKNRKNKTEKEFFKQNNDKISIREESVFIDDKNEDLYEEVEVNNSMPPSDYNFYYIVKSDYMIYKKGDIICNKDVIDNLTPEDLNKLILIKNK